ncbi:MAG: hypothetical protein QM757_04260 [Paludibaculum sp.]
MSTGTLKLAGMAARTTARAEGPPVETPIPTTLEVVWMWRPRGSNFAGWSGGAVGEGASIRGGGAAGVKNWRILGMSSSRRLARERSSPPALEAFAT